MIKSVFSKIKSNIWMFICLIVGSLLITGVLSCIPMYTMGTLKQMLTTDLAAYEKENGAPAGQMYFSGKISSDTFKDARYKQIIEVENAVVEGIKETSVSYTEKYVLFTADDFKPDVTENGFTYSNQWSLKAMDGMDDNIEIVQGRMYETTAAGEAIEVIIEEEEFASNENVELGQEYSFSSDEGTITVIPVGVFRQTDADASFWYNSETLFSKGIFCKRDVFEDNFKEGKAADMISTVGVYLKLDFTKMSIDNIYTFVKYYNGLHASAKTDFGTGRGKFSLNCIDILKEYQKKTTSMQVSLWILNIPVIAMLGFYIIMITKMIIEDDKNEIATFKSRGAKKSQIFLRYVIECGVISVFSVVLGPILGFTLAKTVGNASGFLEFNAREAMPVKFSWEALLYAVAACVIFSVLILVPALMATNKSIVNLKQKKARKIGVSVWSLVAGIACLVVSVGLLVIYERTGGFNTDGTVDPVVYIISSLFMLGCGLVILFIYPFVVAIIFKIIKRIMHPAGYSAFIQVSRGGNDYRFLMLFLAMTVSVGIYSSASARIINNNVENTIKYEYGADVVIEPDMTGYEPYIYNEDGTKTEVPDFFREYPMEKYTDCEFVTAASRVGYYSDNYVMDVERGWWIDGVSIMAIDPYEFGQISWLGKVLNGSEYAEYLNIIEQNPTAVIISQSMANSCHAEVGDKITLDINSSNYYDGEDWPSINCQVAAIVNYWPTIYPDSATADEEDSYASYYQRGHGEEDGDSSEDYEETDTSMPLNSIDGSFVIMNFEYLYSARSTSPFKVFLGLTDDAKTGEQDFAEMALDAGIITDEEQIITYRPDVLESKKSDSMLKGLNGSYSICFVSTLTVAFVGFLLYWIMNVRKRKLQFGILRAMGMTKGNLTEMLIVEHILTTGVSVLMGIVIGAVTVNVFAPLLKVAYSDSILPLEILFNRSDNLKIYIVVGLMLVTGIAVLAAYINKLRINEAVKIGEE